MEQHPPVTQGTEFEVENASVLFKGDYQRIFRYIMSMVRDTAEAEDLTQETFLRAYQRRDSLRDEGAQTAWLYRIATHVCLDRLRQYARRSPKESETDLDEIDVPETDTPSLQQTLERDEMSECVQGYVNPYGLKTSTEETKNKYPDFSTIYEQKSKLTMLEIWRVIMNRSI